RGTTPGEEYTQKNSSKKQAFFFGKARLGGAFGGFTYQPEDQQAAGDQGARCRRVKVGRSFEAHRIKIISWRRRLRLVIGRLFERDTTMKTKSAALPMVLV